MSVAVALTVLLAGCGSDAEGTATPAEPAPSSAAPSPTDFGAQSVDWGSCDGYATDGNDLPSNLQCARITVPVDYSNPTGDTAEIALSRAPATGDKIGSILVNPGGPGASGLSAATTGEATDIAARFDVIGFDPRGIGASTPAVRCLTGPETDAERADDDTDTSPAGIATTEAENKDYAAKCAERTGPGFLAHVGSQDVARDMDVIRSVLGDEKLTYIGYSYGTRIGSTYAQLFPDKVRAMVLDGAIDPEQNPVDEVVDQAAGFQKAFDDFAADCAKTQSCPLGTSPAQAVGQYRRLVNPLLVNKARTTDPRGLSYEDANTGVQQALYSPSLWRALRVGLSQLADGSGDVLLSLADLYNGRLDDGSYSNLEDAFNAVRCVDDPQITDPAEAGELDTRFREAAPFLDDGRGNGAAALDVCAYWPVPSVGTPKVTVSGLAPTVVVSTTDDPATPYEAGVNLARELGGSLITFRGTQHTVAFSGEDCVDEPLVSYLVDLTVPEKGLTC
jgi:pimeloyl-ACP methyl ester carboxylesterase